MFTEILKIRPQIDRAQLNRMANDLGRRFADISKRFGQGLRNALRLSPLFAIAGVALAKLLNPLKKAEDIVNLILGKGDDIVTNAAEFGTDPGKLLRLEAIGTAKGVDSDTMRMLLSKFQEKLASEQELARTDPKATPGVLREFIGVTDVADAFLQYIQSQQKLDRSQQVVIQSQIFGEKIRGKASELLNATDFEDILKRLPSAEELAKAANKAALLNDQKDLNTAIRESQDFVGKSGLLRGEMITTIDSAERQNLKAEDEDLKRFNDLKQISGNLQQLTNQFNELSTQFLKVIAPAIVDGVKLTSEGFAILKPFLTDGVKLLGEKFDMVIETVAGLSFKIENLWKEFKNSRWNLFGN